MNSHQGTACLSEEQLESVAAGHSVEATVQEHAASCDRCREAVAEISANNAFLDAVGSKLPPPREPVVMGSIRPDEPSLSEHTVDPAASTHASFPRSGVVGSCRILSELHRGGQGIVYKAIHASTGRKVAIKTLLRGTLATPQQQRRFEREMEIVANLRHPNIVTLYETGTLPDGRMAFAMEYIHGVPIDQWAKARGERSDAGPPKAVLAAKLRLFARVCDAVQHAHQYGVIHRDLKPGNILVDTGDDPHVLDFGLAKSRGPGGAGIDPTMTGDFRGSLGYASPEQVGNHPELVDTRSDVYSLGAILYEMVTGHCLCPADGTISDLIRFITQEPPKPPSGLCRAVDDELETIILRMVAKEPARRYQSAGAARDDIERYLAGLPIDAKRDSTWYLVRKTVLRHRAAALVGVLALAAGVGIFGMMSRARAAEQLAAVSREETEWVLQFLDQLLESSDPGNPWSSVIHAEVFRPMLDRAAMRLEDAPATTPLEAAIRHRVGSIYQILGSPDRAVVHLQSAVTLRSRELGRVHTDTVASERTLAAALESSGDRDGAEALLREQFETLQEHLGPEDPQTLATMLQLVRVLTNLRRLDEADAKSAGCLTLSRASLGPDAEGTLDAANVRIHVLRRQEEFEAADELAQDTIMRSNSVFGRNHPQTLTAKEERAKVLGTMRRFDEAKELLEEVLESRIELGAPQRDRLQVQHNIAQLMLLRQQFGEAAELFGTVVAARRVLLGDHHHETLRGMWPLGLAQSGMRAYPEAEQTWRLVVDQLHSDRIVDPSAERFACIVLGELSELLTHLGRQAEAERLLEESIEVLTRRGGTTHAHTQTAIGAMVRLYEGWEGHENQAAQYRTKLTPAPAASAPE